MLLVHRCMCPLVREWSVLQNAMLVFWATWSLLSLIQGLGDHFVGFFLLILPPTCNASMSTPRGGIVGFVTVIELNSLIFKSQCILSTIGCVCSG